MNKIPQDKLLHFFYGFFIIALSGVFLPYHYAFLITLLIAIGKEVYDIKKTGFNYADALFTIFPSLIIYLVWL
jgi:hypothetical protein